jgi:hypothetical protein
MIGKLLLDSDRFLRTIESPRLCAVEPRFFFNSPVLQPEVDPFSDGHLPEITPGCTTLLTNSIRFMPASRMSAISLEIRGQSVNLHQLNEELAP